MAQGDIRLKVEKKSSKKKRSWVFFRLSFRYDYEQPNWTFFNPSCILVRQICFEKFWHKWALYGTFYAYIMDSIRNSPRIYLPETTYRKLPSVSLLDNLSYMATLLLVFAGFSIWSVRYTQVTIITPVINCHHLSRGIASASGNFML